jgi:hypothetical protein
VQPQDWLLRLNMWRSRGPTRAAYSDLLKKMEQRGEIKDWREYSANKSA